MKKRRLGRELGLRVLYSWQMQGGTLASLTEGYFRTLPYLDDVLGFSRKLVFGVETHVNTLDKLIVKYSDNWKLERINPVELNIMRVAVYEILYETAIPPTVSINEAIEIAKKYGTGDSGKFVNAILDRIRKEAEKCEKKGNAGK
ncbi:MAG: transcription antitermination factor NusB [Nitrospinota bacterium]